MTLRERRPDERRIQPSVIAPTGQVGLRADAERLLARGGDAIARALSQNSADFLTASRQEGGQ